MANSAQARKRARQSVERNKHNASLRSMLRTSIKRVRQAIDAGDKTVAAEVFK
jgi:small subunit ribosomal protein S20